MTPLMQSLLYRKFFLALVALSSTSLLLTNDHYYSRRVSAIAQTFETFYSFPGGNVILLNFEDPASHSISKVATRVPFANGLAYLKDVQTLAVASSSESVIFLYDFDGRTATMREEVKLDFHVDNLEAHGHDVYVAGHRMLPLKYTNASDFILSQLLTYL